MRRKHKYHRDENRELQAIREHVMTNTSNSTVSVVGETEEWQCVAWDAPVVQGARLRKLIAYFTALAMLFCAGQITEDQFVEYVKEFMRTL